MNRHILKLKITAFLMLTFLYGCKTLTLPSVKYRQYEYKKSFTYSGDTLNIDLKNTLDCPIRIWIYTSNKDLQDKFNQLLPIELESCSDTILTFTGVQNFDKELRFSSRLGSTTKKIEGIELDFPFPVNKEYTVIQANNTNFTHNKDWSRYALDFDLKTNDTICSATDGYVVGAVDKYKFSGTGKEWEPFANFLTIYEPVSGVFCQYVHLVQNGSLVKVGDKVKRGQSIGLSGNTGQSSIEHLHFSCLIPVNSEFGLRSIPIEFIGGQKGLEMKKGDKIKNNSLLH